MHGLVVIAGALVAATLGAAAGQGLALEPGALGPVGGARLYVSGPRLLAHADARARVGDVDSRTDPRPGI